MTDTVTATAPADAATAAPEDTDATDDTAPAENVGENDVPAEEAGNPANKEAAKWRTKFRDAEQQVTDLTETVERLQRLHVDAAITAAGVKPAAVHAVTNLADLLAEDGTPDAAKIAAAVRAARDQLGIPYPTTDGMRQTGMRSGTGFSPPRKDGWSSAFGPRDN